MNKTLAYMYFLEFCITVEYIRRILYVLTSLENAILTLNRETGNYISRKYYLLYPYGEDIALLVKCVFNHKCVILLKNLKHI